jgi:hypothetical protein
MRVIGTLVLAVVAAHAAPMLHHRSHMLHERNGASGMHPATMCSGPATAIAIGVLWPETAIVPISPLIGHWHATLSAFAY